MNGRKKTGDPLDNLASLMSGGRRPSSTPVEEPSQISDEELELRVRTLIDNATALMGPEADIFEVQDLIEAAADEMRFQVRAMVEEADDDE